MTDNVKYYLEDLDVGMRSTTTSVITGEMIDTFADITGDHNPIHVDACLLYTSPSPRDS